jgi:hypothetical protein
MLPMHPLVVCPDHIAGCVRRVLVAAPHCPPVGAPMHAGNASSAKWLPHSGIRTV